MTVSGAYGRDYKSAKTALQDFADGRDFLIRDLGADEGRYVNIADLATFTGFVEIRFNGDRGVTCIKFVAGKAKGLPKPAAE